MNRRLFMFILLTAAVGCDSGPRAPALRDEPVYRNSRDGFRFRTPIGWTQTAKSDPRPGVIDREELLVRFEQQTGEAPAVLELTCIDLGAEEPLAARLAMPSHSIKSWTLVGESSRVVVGGADGLRFIFRDGKQQKEVTAIRRTGRVFLFTTLHVVQDTRSRDQARDAVDSLTWD